MIANIKLYRVPLLSSLLLLVFTSAQAFQIPECDGLEKWSSGYVAEETVSLTPKVQVTSLLANDKAVAVFGQPALEWSARDLKTLRNGMNKCRKLAHKRKDKKTADQLYKVIKVVDKARGPLNKVVQLKNQTTQNVDRLVKYRPSDRLARQIALSVDALQGREPDLAAHGLRTMPNWIGGFKQAAGFLPKSDIDAYVATLNARKAEMENSFNKLASDFAAAKQELTAAPLTAAGMQTLDRLQNLSWLKQLTPQEQDAFSNDINSKRRQYAEMQRRQQAQQQPRVQSSQTGPATYSGRRTTAAAETAPDMKTYLDELLTGDDVEDLTLKGLAPGVPKQQAIRHAMQKLGLRETVNLSFRLAYGLRNILVEFKSMDDDTVGEVDYTARFKAPLDVTLVVASLTERFGKPDKTEPVPAGQRLTWHDDGRVLQVIAANRVNNLLRGYQSRLAVALYSETYESYLENVNNKCGKLSDTPMNELSLSQKQYLAGHCALMGSTHKEAGLEAAL